MLLLLLWHSLCPVLCTTQICGQVMVINCAMTNPAQVALWEPTKSSTAAAAAVPSSSPGPPGTPVGGDTAASPAQQQQQQSERPWLPWLLQIRSDPSNADVDVITADSVEELADLTRGGEVLFVQTLNTIMISVAISIWHPALKISAIPSRLPVINLCLCFLLVCLLAVSAAPVQASYALTALICHITDEAEAEQAAAAKRGPGGVAAAGGAGALALISPAAAAAAVPRTPGGSSSSVPCIYQVRTAIIGNSLHSAHSLTGISSRLPCCIKMLLHAGRRFMSPQNAVDTIALITASN